MLYCLGKQTSSEKNNVITCEIILNFQFEHADLNSFQSIFSSRETSFSFFPSPTNFHAPPEELFARNFSTTKLEGSQLLILKIWVGLEVCYFSFTYTLPKYHSKHRRAKSTSTNQHLHCCSEVIELTFVFLFYFLTFLYHMLKLFIFN